MEREHNRSDIDEHYMSQQQKSYSTQDFDVCPGQVYKHSRREERTSAFRVRRMASLSRSMRSAVAAAALSAGPVRHEQQCVVRNRRQALTESHDKHRAIDQ
jgi:hypothetical protein